MQDNKPLVSAIVPCFRMEKYLKLFLDELPNQTIFDRLQIVLDHNEPTEEELVWVKDFQEKYPGRLKHLITNPVIPIGNSMNKCIQNADADFVCIWNIDDLRTPSSIEKQVNILLENDDIGVSHGNFIIVRQFGSKEGSYVDHTWTLNKSEELTRGMMLGPFFCFRKNLCNKIGYFDEQLRSGADFDLAIRLANETKIGMTSDVLGFYLDEGKGASTKGDGLQQIERTLIELRYGILDKIEHRYLSKALEYDIRNIVNFGENKHVTELVRNYQELLNKNDKREE